MNENPSNNVMPPDEELVAYLDGELDADAVRRIEALLASDPEVRRRLQSLERTWDLLDELDEAAVGEPFTRSTLEMVTVAARHDLEQNRKEGPGRWRSLAFGGILAAAAAAGFLAIIAFVHDPNRQLLDDLPLLENLEEYRQVQSIEFLRKLREAGLFAGTGAESPAPATVSDEDEDARRRRVEAMNPDQKRELRRGAERFSGLAPEEQRRLRGLHEDLCNDSDAERLRRTMRGYCEWLNALSSYSQAELAEMAPHKRIAWVKHRIEEEQKREGGRRPGDKDMEAVREWMAAFLTRNEANFLAALTEQQRKRISEIKGDQMRRHMMFAQMGPRWQSAGPGKLPPMMTDADLAELRKRLSLETRKRLDGKPPVEQWQLVSRWMRQGGRRPGDDRRPPGPPSRDDDERLAQFFENDLTDEQRDRLLAMPGEEMQRALQRMFVEWVRSPEASGRRPDGGHRNNRFGGPERPVPKK